MMWWNKNKQVIQKKINLSGSKFYAVEYLTEIPVSILIVLEFF